MRHTIAASQTEAGEQVATPNYRAPLDAGRVLCYMCNVRGPARVSAGRYNPRNFLWEIVRDFVATKYRVASAVLPPPLAPPPATGGGDDLFWRLTQGGGDPLPRRSPCPGLDMCRPRWGLLVGCRPPPAGEGEGGDGGQRSVGQSRKEEPDLARPAGCFYITRGFRWSFLVPLTTDRLPSVNPAG